MITLQERVHAAPKPDDWSLDKLHRVLRVRRGNRNTGLKERNLLSLSYGRIVEKDIEAVGGLLPENFDSYQVVEPGDIVLRLTDLQNDKRSLRQGLVTTRGIITSAYDAVEVQRDNDPRFWFYSLLALDLSKHYYSLGGGVRQSVKFSDFPNDWIYRPDLAVQRHIADFLDEETARIDLLLEKKQRLVELLEEKWASIVEEAISAQSKLTKLGHHVDILSGYAFPSSDFSSDNDDIRLLRGANISPGLIKWHETVYWPRERLGEVSRFVLSRGDVVLGMDRPWISSGIRIAELSPRDSPALLLQRVCRISPRETLDKGFMKLLLSSRRFLAYFEPIMTGVSVPHISPDQVGSFRFAYIPREEQETRASTAEIMRNGISSVKARTKESVDRLRELRAAIITAAVTGQIDVMSYTKAGRTDRRLDEIQEEMRA